MVIRVGPNPMTGAIIKSGNLDRDTQGENHVKMEEAIGVMNL